jgi:hypothetical protein
MSLDISQLSRPPRLVSGIALFVFFSYAVFTGCNMSQLFVQLCERICFFNSVILCDTFICVLYCHSDIATGKDPFAT